jgi:hypothetical protein
MATKLFIIATFTAIFMASFPATYSFSTQKKDKKEPAYMTVRLRLIYSSKTTGLKVLVDFSPPSFTD